MSRGIWAILGMFICGASQLSAQLPGSSSLPDDLFRANDMLSPVMADLTARDNCSDSYQIWARGEYLQWWVKSAPLPIPLVTTGDLNDPAQAAIGGATTQVLLGNSNLSFRAFSGMSFTLGGWFDGEQTVGIEASAFLLERRSSVFAASSNGNGNPVLAFPYSERDPAATGEGRILISFPPTANTPFPLAGTVQVTSTLQLWGTELNGVFCLRRTPGFEFTFLTGFRYADLQESLGIRTSSADFFFNPTSLFNLNDSFQTRNQFYGGQIGTRIHLERDRLSLDATGKLALGSTHQVVDIRGSLSQSGPVNFSAPYGLFTEPSNIGRSTANQFTVLPCVELKLGYKFTQYLQAFVGYDYLYWNQVVRPGNQIDRNINTTQNAALGAGALTGPASPMPLFNRTDFWAQGVNFGLQFRY